MSLNFSFLKQKKKEENKRTFGNTFNIEKIISFFLEKPKASQFELSEDNCEINREEPYYTFVKGRFEEIKEYEPRCFSIKELEDVEEEIYINFCPVEENAIPVYPFLWEFFQLKQEEYPHIKVVIIIIPPREFGCRTDPTLVYLLRIFNEQTQESFLENFKLEQIDISFLTPQLYGLSNALIVLPKIETIKESEIRKALNLFLKEQKREETFLATKEEQNIIEFKDNVLLEVVEEAYSNVIVPKIWKIRNIVSLFFAIATMVGGIYGYQKYLEWKHLQELKSRKIWIPSRSFKENHFGYLLDVEKTKWKKLSEVFYPSVVQVKNLNADKRKASVIKESPAPLKGFSLRGDKYYKLEIISFPSYPSWKQLRGKPAKPLKSFKEVYERFKTIVGPKFIVNTYPSSININDFRLKCAEVNVDRKYPLLDVKAFLKALSKTDLILKKATITKGESDYFINIKGFICGK